MEITNKISQAGSVDKSAIKQHQLAQVCDLCQLTNWFLNWSKLQT